MQYLLFERMVKKLESIHTICNSDDPFYDYPLVNKCSKTALNRPKTVSHKRMRTFEKNWGSAQSFILGNKPSVNTIQPLQRSRHMEPQDSLGDITSRLWVWMQSSQLDFAKCRASVPSICP